jgi:hypothetical protein
MASSPLLKEFAEIKLRIAELEKRKDEIEVQVIEEIDNLREHNREVVTPYGTFSLGSRKTWKYSPAVDVLKEKLSEAKKEEEATGLAVLMKDSQWPVFKPTD